jgi:hypothetical protein
MQHNREGIRTSSIDTGACYDCPLEKNGLRINPPINTGPGGRALIVCRAQNGPEGRTMLCKNDIGSYKECEHYKRSQQCSRLCKIG